MESAKKVALVTAGAAAALIMMRRRRKASPPLESVPLPKSKTAWVVACIPNGAAALEHFRKEEHPLRQELDEGEFVLKTLYLEPHPAMFGRIRQESNYAASVKVGEVMHCGGVAQVIRSRDPSFPAGTVVNGMVQMQDFQVTTAAGNAGIPWSPLLSLLRTPLEALTLLSLNNLTAYFFLRDLGRPKPKQTVLVSAAAGHVGSVAGQMAILLGCKAVALCGSDAKCEQCTTTFGYAAAVNYKRYQGDPAGLTAALQAACPAGVDVLFDNTSGDLPLAVFPLFNLHARWVVCGRIALAALKDTLNGDVGVRDASLLITKRIAKIGGLVHDFFPRTLEGSLACIKWSAQGKLRVAVDEVRGVSEALPAQLRLLSGDHSGKIVVRCGELDLPWPRPVLAMAARAALESAAFPTAFVCWLLRVRANWSGKYCGL